ncbi:MAG: lamin tail domain-containing protein [Cyclobacteriaceae bacterium]|nr:lamin tail domain-containing protein [Cyclobacteriaceae bacterium]
MKRIISILVILTLAFSSCVKDDVVPDKPEQGSVVLNEIMAKDPVTDLDWIELYNTSDSEVDISGYMLNDKADPNGGFVIPNGTTIAAYGFYVVEQPELTIAISSGGEDVSLGNAEGNVIDYIAVPASLADGTTFGRATDGEEPWVNGMPATKGATNAAVDTTVPTLTLDYNVAPAADSEVQVELTYATTATVTEARIYYGLGDSPAYNKDNKIKGEDDASFTQTGVTITMLDATSGDNLSVAGEKVSFYVRLALDNGYEYYFDKDGKRIADDTSTADDDTDSDTFKADPTQWNTYTAIAGGVSAPIISEMVFSATPTKGFEAVDLTYSADINIVEARIYFGYGDTPEYIKENRVKGEDEASFTQTSVTIPLSNLDVEDADGNIIGNSSDGAKISFYVRIALENGNEYYYDKDGNIILDDTSIDTDDGDSDDFKADPSLWNTYTPKNPVSVTAFNFPDNPTSTQDINVVIEYSGDEEIVEARIYYALGDTPEYIKDNRVKGEDDASFTQTGVTINMKDLDVVDADGNSVGTTSDSGKKVSFYLRIATATSEYYYDKDGSLYVDDTLADGATDESDDFKEDPALWNVYNVQ